MSILPIETEIKLEINDPNKFEEVYSTLGNPDWILQKNYIFSFNGNILRIRLEGNKAFLTSKGKNTSSELDVRPEVECEIPVSFFNNFSEMCRDSSLPLFYEKYRASAKYSDCIICLDKFYGKTYLEIEGDEKEVKRLVSVLGLINFKREKRGYFSMVKEMRENDKKNLN